MVRLMPETRVAVVAALLAAVGGCAGGAASPRAAPRRESSSPAATASAPAPAPSASTAPAADAEPASDTARAAIRDAFGRLSPALPEGARLAADAARSADGAALQVQVLLGEDTHVGTLIAELGTGAVAYQPNDGRGTRLGVDAFVARHAEEEKAVAAVAALPVVKALCAKARAQGVSCSISFAEWPSDESCGRVPQLESSCWMRVSVLEIHPTHATTLGTFLLEPRTLRVAGAVGYCRAVVLPAYRGPGSGC